MEASQSTTAAVVEFDSDKLLVRTLFNNFEFLLVFIFYSEANEESKRYLAKLAKLKTTYNVDGVKWFTLAAERCPETFKQFRVEAVPTVIFTQTDRKVLVRIDGQSTSPAQVLDSLMATAEQFQENFRREKSKWHPKIESILNSCPVIVFMKGTPQAPKCGFTEQMLEVLQQHNVQYSHYDIIADEYMRYWLRNYSGWPTYPQLYIDGKLIGGLDVVRDLVAKGEFDKLLKKSMKVASGEERLKRILEESRIVVLLSNFAFEDTDTKKFVDQVKSKYPAQQISIVNISLDDRLKDFVEKEGYKAPCLFIDGKKQ